MGTNYKVLGRAKKTNGMDGEPTQRLAVVGNFKYAEV